MDDICSKPSKLLHIELAKLSDNLREKVNVDALRTISNNAYTAKVGKHDTLPRAVSATIETV